MKGLAGAFAIQYKNSPIFQSSRCTDNSEKANRTSIWSNIILYRKKISRYISLTNMNCRHKKSVCFLYVLQSVP